MVEVVRDGLWFCDCCVLAAVNGDDSICCDEKHAHQVAAGLDRLTAADTGGHIVPDYDSETGEGIEEFSWRSCACCDDGKGGSRHRMAVLK